MLDLHFACKTFLLAAAALLAALPTLASEIVTREFASTALQKKWAYEVYLPSRYESSRAHYPVLYLLHGNEGSRRAAAVIRRARRWSAMASFNVTWM